MLVDLAGHAEAIDGLVVHERGVRRSRLSVVLVVVARAISHICREVGRESLLAVALHEVDDVVGDESREPADAVAHLVPRSDVRRCGAHHRDSALVPTGLPRAVTEQSDAPSDEARIGELDDRAVGDAARELEGLRPVARDPDRQTLLSGPIEAQGRALVRDLAPFAQVANDVRRFLEHREVGRLLPEDAPSRIPAPDAEVHASAGELLEDREDARRHRRFARGRVRHACPEPHALGVLSHERERHVGLLPQDVAVEEPPVREAGGVSDATRSSEWSGLRVNPKSMRARMLGQPCHCETCSMRSRITGASRSGMPSYCLYFPASRLSA